MLLGLAVGDGLGAPFEGSRKVSERKLGAVLADSSPLPFTDDTAMAIGLTESLLDRDGFDGDHMMARFAVDHAAEPWRGYGAGPPQIFAHYRRGVPWGEAAGRVFSGTGSYGNGGAMRVAPVALFANGDLATGARLATSTAALTHAHPLGAGGAVLQAVAVTLALRLTRDQPVDTRRFCTDAAAWLSSDLYRDKLKRVQRLLDLGAAGPEVVAAELGRASTAPDSVPTALFCFLRHPTSFAGAVTFAVRLGGDTDTIAAMTGALSGAFLGEEAIPVEWLERAEQTVRLRRLADRLWERTR